MRILSIIGFVFLAMFSCTDKGIQSHSLYGKWKLTQYYYSPGGPGVWKNASTEDTKFLEFKEDGKVIHSGPRSQTFTEEFRLIKDTIVFVRNTGEIKTKYLLRNDSLRLLPPCIEGCEEVYLRFDGSDK